MAYQLIAYIVIHGIILTFILVWIGAEREMYIYRVIKTELE